MPKYLLNNEILFVRADGDSFSLWKTKDGVETKLSDSLSFNSGYIQIVCIMDITKQKEL